MINNVLDNILKKNGVTKINAHNQKFDPNLHEALSEIEDPNLEPGTCAYVAQNGYLIGERILRASKVMVVKNRPASE